MTTPHADTAAKVEMPPAATVSAPASAYAELVRGAGGVVLNLFGAIGPDKLLCLENIKAQLRVCSPRYVHLIINSTGGNVAETKRIYSFLRNLPAVMSAEVGDHCQSAAVTLLLAAAYRMAKVDSLILIHATRMPTASIKSQEMTARDLRALADGLQQDDNEAIDVMSERTGYCRTWFEEQFQNEDSLSVYEALESGIVHEVGALSMRCDPGWIEQHRSARRDILWPRRYFTANFLAACRAALPRGGSCAKGETTQ